MEKITKLNIQLLEHKVVEEVFEKDLPDIKIVFSAFSDSWSFVLKNIKHSLYYDSIKKCKLIS